MRLTSSLAAHLPALRSRDFAIFWSGQFLSLIGTWMQNTTQPLLAYRLSGRPLDLGLIGAAVALPTFFLALPGGVLVEHLDKRKTVIAMQAVMMVQSFTMAVLALTGVIQIWHIAVLSFVLGTASSIEITARQAMLIELVGKEALPNAIALQSTIFNAARVLGPSLVAPFLILIGEQGEGWAFLANSASYLFVIIGLLFVRTQYRAEAPIEKRNPLAEFKEGQQYIVQTASVGFIIILAAALGLFGFPIIQQIPVFAKDVLHQIGDTEATIAARNSLLYVAQGAGALVAALFISFYSNMRRKGLLLTLGQYAFVLGLVGVAFPRRLDLIVVLIAIMGWGGVTQLATMNTLIQLQVPNGLRGRVFSAYLWALQGVAPLGSLLVGWMAQSWGISTTALICGLICGVTITTIHIISPTMRRTIA
jgi:MFS family permease